MDRWQHLQRLPPEMEVWPARQPQTSRLREGRPLWLVHGQWRVCQPQTVLPLQEKSMPYRHGMEWEMLSSHVPRPTVHDPFHSTTYEEISHLESASISCRCPYNTLTTGYLLVAQKNSLCKGRTDSHTFRTRHSRCQIECVYFTLFMFVCLTSRTLHFTSARVGQRILLLFKKN